MIKDILTDIVEHTHKLGIPLVKIEGTDTATGLEALAEDKSVVVQAAFKQPVADFQGTFGMPNLGKLDILLNIEEYKKDSKITVTSKDRNGVSTLDGIHFENAGGDFKNDYRFMSQEIVNDKLKKVTFKGANWDLEFQPTVASIARLKMQAAANAEENLFTAKTEDGDLKFEFGDHSTHAGAFVFQPSVENKLTRAWSWPVKQVIAILDLDGDKTIHFTNQGAAQITVDSGLVVYKYLLPAQTK